VTRDLEQLVLLHPLVIEHFGEIALSGVAEQGDYDGLRIIQFASYLESDSNIQTG
jgi:hypothetical protein